MEEIVLRRGFRRKRREEREREERLCRDELLASCARSEVDDLNWHPVERPSSLQPSPCWESRRQGGGGSKQG
eukprot:281582-Hanusia_phi.AAC.1